MSTSISPPPSQPRAPTRGSMRDSLSCENASEATSPLPTSPPPFAQPGSPWAQHELEQEVSPTRTDAQQRAYAPRDSGISLNDREPGASPSHELDGAGVASPRSFKSGARAQSPRSLTGARSSPRPASSFGATSPPSVHPRPPSALSSTSSSHAHTHHTTSSHTFPSPRPVPQPYASSSLSSAAAFDYDDLLGPHPRKALSGTSVSPPSSNEDDKLRRALAGEMRVQGLGFASARVEDGAAGAGFGGVYGALDAGDDYGESEQHGQAQEEDAAGIEECWAPLRNMSLSSAVSTPPPAAQQPPTIPSNPSSRPHTGQPTRKLSMSSAASVSGSAAVVGSPLSPHVAPFAPSSMGVPTQGSPWAHAREREASWTSVASSTYALQAHQRALSTLASSSSAMASTPAHLVPSNTTPSHASQHSFAHTGESSSMATPITGEAGSRGSGGNTGGLGGETYFVTRGPRTPYGDRSADAGAPGAYGFTTGASSAARPGSSAGLDAMAVWDVTVAGDVSTIFVVGFPDDMTEREFINMFAFAPGFEAATLKFPWPKDGSVAGSDVGDRVEEPSASYGQQQQPLATAFEGFATGTSTPLSATASTNGTTTLGNGMGNASARKIIGFARFATRQHALDARDMLSGRRIDVERGSVLKAEMAKKNLHMRKNVVVTTTGGAAGSSTPSSSSATALASAYGSAYSAQMTLPGAAPQTTTGHATAAIDAAIPVSPAAVSSSTPAPALSGSGPSIPLSALDSATLQKLAQSNNLNPAVLAEIARQNAAKAATTWPTGDAGAAAAYEAFHRRSDYYEYEQTSLPAQHPSHVGGGYPQAPSSAASASPPHQPSLPPSLGAQRSMLQQLDEGVLTRGAGGSGGHAGMHSREPSYVSGVSLSPTAGGPIGAPNPYSMYASPGPGAAPLSPTLAAATVGPVPSAAARQAAMHPLGSPPVGFSPMLGAVPRTQNPADMNAPKNTLYVGGLPAVLPSLTGPFSASHLEDSLRNAFSRCPGYKRLQFRYKSNGPIVFVEFVDTPHATRAMQELYGHTLGGLVKGGIRLSYSKNPLGVRSNGQPALATPESLDQRPSLHALPLLHQQQQQLPSQGTGQGLYGGAGPFVGSPPAAAGSFAFDPVGVDAYRRQPDPVPGETAYSRSPASAPSNFAMPAGGHAFGVGPSGGVAAPSFAAATSLYGGSFSPFSVEL